MTPNAHSAPQYETQPQTQQLQTIPDFTKKPDPAPEVIKKSSD